LDPDEQSYSMAVDDDTRGANRPNVEKPLLRSDLLAVLALVVAVLVANARDLSAIVMFVRLLCLAAAAQRVYLDLGPPKSGESRRDVFLEILRRRVSRKQHMDADEQARLDIEDAVRTFLWRASLLLDAWGVSLGFDSHLAAQPSEAASKRHSLCSSPPAQDASVEAWCSYFGVPPIDMMLNSSAVCSLIARWTAHADSDPNVPTELWTSVRPELIPLPKAYTELHTELTSRITSEHPAICLVCGEVLCAEGKGACTRHAVGCGAGIGIFFLLQECSLLFVHGPRACYFASPYVDAYGERHGQFRGRPLFLYPARIEVVRRLWATHAIADQVVQSRSTSRQIIRNSYY